MHFENKLRIVLKVIEEYPAPQPLNLYLKDHARLHRNMGSRDRKFVASKTYAWFRLGHALPNAQPTARLAAALFLVNDTRFAEFDQWLYEQEFPGALAHAPAEIADRIQLLEKLIPEFSAKDILPPTATLSDNVDHEKYTTSLFVQSLVWVRVRHAHASVVNEELQKQNIVPVASLRKGLALGFEGNPQLTALKCYEQGLIEIQDLSSQNTIDDVAPTANDKVWDCCAGAGGKSLMVADAAAVELTVSDVRESILHNLSKRFEKAGIKKYYLHNCDLEKGRCKEVKPESMDTIVADLPCSGSGTWARSPEQIATFGAAEMADYNHLQRTIVANAWPALKPGGKLVYITCSVFKAENEDMVGELAKSMEGAEFVSGKILDGMTQKSDSMFVAILQKKV